MAYDPFLGYDPATYNPYGNAVGYDPSYVSGQVSLAQQQAQQAYQQAQTQNQSDQLAFQQAQAAFTNAMSLGNAYGYSTGGSTQFPAAGTPLQSTMNTLGYAGAIPGVTGNNTGATASYQQQLANMAAQSAGLTGFYNAPKQSAYSPGTFLRIDPSTYDYATNGDQIEYVTPSGQLQRVPSMAQAKAMGFNGNVGDLPSIPYSQAATLEGGPPQYLPQQTIQAQQQYQAMNTQAQQSALAVAGATGMYSAPTQIYAPGTNAGGGKFQDLPQDVQNAYYYSNGGDWTAAMNKWVADSNNAIAQASGGQLPNQQPGTPQETLAAQNQYFNQAQQYAQTYGQYYAPNAPGGTAQAGVNAPQAGQQTLAGQQQAFSQNLQTQQFQQQAAQSYLNLLSQLQGPADYGQYLKVLGSTPSGIQGLVGAAAGNYVPGTGSSGVAPQAQTLQNLVGAASGQGGGGSGANAGTSQPNGGTSGTASPGGMNYNDFMATAQGLPAPSQIAPQAFNNMLPSQQQLMGSMYSNLGYAQGDINKMYQQSLPKYAAGSSAGNFKLV